ncbi:sensor histidine kinase [Anaerosporobacter faecicola]|uniref:sensor histidine kinase n=1 Tax=Anaerosporobacter faecicola TaxID=2718714 RepID=UPI00143B823D|nr:HAMP domain-containing sensor histidine kinase [Anaerosporobacter faecicola]
MLTKLKNRLVLFYGFSTTIILIIVMSVVCIMDIQQKRQYEQRLFESNINQLVDQFTDSNSIDSRWFIQFQEKNKLMVQIEDNDISIPNYFSLHTKISTSTLVSLLLETAEDHGYNMTSNVLTKQKSRSGIYTLRSTFQESYMGCIVQLKSNNSRRTLYIIKVTLQPGVTILSAIIRYGIITLFGSLFLFLFSFLFIKKVMKPLEIGQQKQVEFIAAASHELRSPLTVIRTGITTMQRTPEEIPSILPHIEKESSRMGKLINDLLLLAASDSKSWSLNMDSIDMETLLIEVYDTFCTLYNNNRIPIELHLPDESLPNIYGDQDRIKQVLTILMDNGLRYTDQTKGLALIVSLSNKRTPTLLLDLIDYGPGIPDEQKRTIFDRFYQMDQSRSDKKHYGLGLSIAKELIQQHGGTIQVLDTKEGGATFHIELPTVKRR